MDRLVKALALDGKIRIIIANTEEIVKKAADLHDLSPTVRVALGRFLTAGVLMGATLKNAEDKLTLIMKGNGPIGDMVICANKDSIVKGYAQNPIIDVDLDDSGKFDVGAAVGKFGNLTVIKDIGLRNPYSGNVNIVSGEIGDEIAKYFIESEQTASAVSVGVLLGKKAEIISSGGYILQLMPNTEDIIINMIEERIKNMKPLTMLLEEGFTLEEILSAVTGDSDIEIIEEITPKFICDCSEERMQKALDTLSREEKERMIEEDGQIEMKCSFCGKKKIWKEI